MEKVFDTILVVTAPVTLALASLLQAYPWLIVPIGLLLIQLIGRRMDVTTDTAESISEWVWDVIGSAIEVAIWLTVSAVVVSVMLFFGPIGWLIAIFVLWLIWKGKGNASSERNN